MTKRTLLLAAFLTIATGSRSQTTFCNPLNLNYRFSDNLGSYREAADPMVVLFNGDYYLFASKSGGYWWSNDFQTWTFVTPTGIDIDKYAPTAWVYNNRLYYTSSESGDIYRATNPKTGTWTKVCDNPHAWNDPWIFVDDDQHVYAYWGSAENGNISCCELDPKNSWKPKTDDQVCIETNTAENGYEVAGEHNEGGNPWTEGAAMFKYNGRYYLTYATPATQQRSYCDGYYVSDSPTGPFTLGANSPATFKELGFVTGTGHGGLFTDKQGHIWTIDCVNLSRKAWFERRLAIFPVEIDDDGLLHTNTTFGDYPLYLPDTENDGDRPSWNLLSYGKPATASSALTDSPVGNAFDEDMRTCWSATTGDAGEWLQVDLGSICSVRAIQANYYESETTYQAARTQSFTTRYLIEGSTDGTTWITLVDKSETTLDAPHDYNELSQAASVRYVRITNKGEVPGGGNFALMGFRVFGSADGELPGAVKSLRVTRQSDKRCATLTWSRGLNADGYIVRYGIAPDKLWNHYQVWGQQSLTIRSLITTQDYYFRVDAYNANGVTEGAVSKISIGTGIPSVGSDGTGRADADSIYSLSGVKVGRTADALTSLPAGIYIHNHRKVILR